MAANIILATFDTVLLPDVDYRLGISEIDEQEKSRIKIDGGKAILLPLKEECKKEELKKELFYPLGVLIDIEDIGEGPMGTYIQGRSREKVRVNEIHAIDGYFEGDWETVDEVMDVTFAGEEALLERFKKTATSLASQMRGGEYAVQYIRKIGSVNEFAAAFCQFFDMTVEEKYALLKTDSFKERGLLVNEALKRFEATIDLQIKLANADDPDAKAYKKAAIQKQIGLLEEALSEIEPEEEEDEDSFENRIAKAGMPDEVRKEAESVLKRLKRESPNGAEYNSLYEYMEFITQLKWQVGETPKIDLKKAERILNRDHYGLKKVKERILQYLAVMALQEENKEENGGEPKKGTILLLVGAPGTGKTSMGRSVAEALGRKYVRISLGGIRDEAEIRGHRRTYIGAMPGRIMDGIKRSGVMNPVIVLDEVDKLQASYNGDPSAALLEVLDPEQNTTFEDHYVNLPYDLSHVVFICTANTWSTIPQPLLDRLEVIELPGYTPDEHFHIAKEHLVKQVLTETGLSKKELRFTDGALKKIISDYTMEAGVRGLKKQLLAVCRKAAVSIVGGQIEDKEREEQATQLELPIVIREKNITDYLGNKKFIHDKVRKNNPAGVVTGLAWTQAGGEILFIESVAMKGTGQIHLTGQIGDVMKESAETAVSLVKSTFMDEELDFKDKDLHIHIPEGAVPKDGPSAGITMFTAVTSLVTGIRVNPELAMTGEISLRGQVLPIGGLPEKLMAAVRAGIKKVLIPKDNVRDLDDVPKETLEKLEIVPVSDVSEVIREALHISLPKHRTSPFTLKNRNNLLPAANTQAL